MFYASIWVRNPNTQREDLNLPHVWNEHTYFWWLRKVYAYINIPKVSFLLKKEPMIRQQFWGIFNDESHTEQIVWNGRLSQKLLFLRLWSYQKPKI